MQNRVNTLRQTHSAVTTMMPLLTAGLTVAGAVIAAMEARNAGASATEAVNAAAEHVQHHDANAATEGEGAEATTQGAATTRPLPRTAPIRRRARRLTALGYVATLVARLLMVVLGIAIVLAITIAATSTGKVGEAITITALILLTLYLTEKVARQG